MRADPIPDFLGYAVVELLHTGPRSSAYRARRLSDQRPVILKVGHAGPGAIDESLARLRHEMAILTAIRSDCVVRPLDVLRIGDDAVLVLEDIGGESVDRHLARGRFSLAEALRLACTLATALCDVHAARIIHKDVNPSNVVYNPATGQARLIDFDVATAWRTERRRFSSPRTLEGTLRYMAPEQTGRMNRAIDSRADLYAFGVTLFELLTGRLPFTDTDILSIVHAHLAVRPPAPDAIDPTIPRPVSAVVMKLLAKAPEDRYQTATGLLADLQTCLDRFTPAGEIADFALGRGDIATRFELPTKLYGRRAELAVLTGAFERVGAGAVETVLVSGQSGVGKTSVVRELFPLITRDRGYFLSGKFDQLRGDSPYPALVAAFDELTHQLLTESEDQLARWRELIAAAVEPSGRVLTDAIPALERIIGPQQALIALDAAGTQSRFRLTLQKFLQVFTRRAHPVVLFLDDMQWADPESIQLLKLVALSESTEALLLLQAFRHNEVSDGHSLLVATRELCKHGQVTRLEVAPLPVEELTQLIADTLHRDPDAVLPLAHLVHRKTDGNPFFVRQLLLALHDAGHIRFDPELARFTFDTASIDRAPISENVADLLADSLRKLPASTQRTLAMAAAIGNRFELDMLALIAEDSPDRVQAELTAALREELVVPLSELEYVAVAHGAGLVVRRLRFQHDRVQRAAYALMSPDDQQRMHLRIGRLLLAGTPPGELSERIFDIVSHLNRAVALIDTPDERRELARLDVIAARKAHGSAAYVAAVELLGTAVRCFDWQADYREQFEAHAMLAECCTLSGATRRALEVLDAAAVRAAHHRDRSALEALRATFHIHANDMKAAVRCTRLASALLGRELPADPAALGTALGAAIALVIERIAGREIEQLIDLPAMTDLDSLALMALYRTASPAVFQNEPALGAYLSVQMVLLSLEHGNCPTSAYGYCTFASVLQLADLGHLVLRFGKLGVDLSLRLDDPTSRASVEFAFALFIAPWYVSLDEAIDHMRTANRCGREVNDHVHAGGAALFEIMYRMFRGGEPLAEIAHDAQIYRRQCEEVGDLPSARILGWQLDHIRVLTGELASLTAGDPDSQVNLMATREEANVAHQFILLHMLVDVALTKGDDAAALDLATATRPLESMVLNGFVVADHRFLHCVAAAAMCRRRPGLQAELLPVIEANQRALARSAATCPATFEAMYLLVEAERATPASDLGATLALYDRATASAARHGRRRLEALASELHGRLWLGRDRPEIAQLYLTRARNLYATLGFQGKVRQLESKHPAIARNALHRATDTGTSGAAAEVLDVTAIAKATRAISGELELDKLLERMLEIIFENAGAEGGALVLDGDRGLFVAASRAAGAGKTSTARVALAAAVLPRSIIHYVQRTEAVVVLDDATADPRFGNDEHIRTLAPRSILCMPVKHQDRMIGMLYLENTLVSGAFTPARLDALTILVSQIAVSLENATLFAAQRGHAEAISRAYDELRGQIAVREQAERELAQYRAHLEELIAERTKELTLANQRLRDAAAEHARIEAELRLASKLESVGRLAAGIAHEINTPVQFVSDNLTFLRDALPGMIDTIATYRELAAAVEARGDVAAATAAARTTEAASDVDYALTNTPLALDAAREGLGRVAAIVRSMKEFAHPDRDEKTPVDLNRAIESTLVIAANECKYVAEVHTELTALPMVRCHVTAR